MEQITIKLNEGTEVTAHVDESAFAKLNQATTLNQHTNTLSVSATVLSSRARTGYERVRLRECYYTSAHDPYSSPAGTEGICCEHGAELFKKGDYVNDEQLYNDRDRARVLHNRLEQWQALNDEPVDWGKTTKAKYKIIFNYSLNDFRIFTSHDFREINIVYFSNKEKAQEAIEVFRDELMWYYTEYRSRLDEPIHSNKT